MSDLHIKELEVENFRCFNKQSFKFAIPDGTNPGSGLTLLLGENANGKTTVLDAINYLTSSSYQAEGRLSPRDFNYIKSPIIINGKTGIYKRKLPSPYKGYIECNGLVFTAKSRHQKSAGKLLSPPFQASTKVSNTRPTYSKEDGTESGKKIPPLAFLFSNPEIVGSELNIFMFDKGRSRQLVAGTYKTLFERICDDLNWKFLKSVDEDMIKRLSSEVNSEYFQKILEIAQKGLGDKIAKDVASFFNDKIFENIRIDLFDLSHPFSNAFFSLRLDDTLKQLRTRDIGSGIEMILSLLLLNLISGVSKGDLIYLIDEPELHLHPTAQDNLFQRLLNESKDKQVVVSTHSPWMFKNGLNSSAKINILIKEDDGTINVVDARSSKFGVFPWSPSWGEISYHGYKIPTIEYHNELYGYLQDKEKLYGEQYTETWLENSGVKKPKNWIKEKNGTTQNPYDVTLCTYIRNSIHHPENTHNKPFTQNELKESIEILINKL